MTSKMAGREVLYFVLLAASVFIGHGYSSPSPIKRNPLYAGKYIEMVKRAINTKETENEATSTLWKAKHGTAVDHEATLAFLSLRQSYNEKFIDKKTCKNTLWTKIREQLNEMGYFVGEGVSGREKCRQKFANLQSSYLRTREKRKRTGEGKVQDSPYFAEMDAILGDKHKTQPLLVIDSLNRGPSSSNSEDSHYSQPSTSQDFEICSESQPSTSRANLICPTTVENRFTNLKSTVRPATPRNKALEELVSIQRENQNNRKEEFKAMVEMFNQQNQRQHAETMALIAAMSSATKKQKTDEN